MQRKAPVATEAPAKKGFFSRSSSKDKKDKADKANETVKTSTAAVLAASATPASAAKADKEPSSSSARPRELSRPSQPPAQKLKSTESASSAPAAKPRVLASSAAAAAAAGSPVGSPSTPAAAGGQVEESEADQKLREAWIRYYEDLGEVMTHRGFGEADAEVSRQMRLAHGFIDRCTALLKEGTGAKHSELIDRLRDALQEFGEKRDAFAKVINDCSDVFALFNQKFKERGGNFEDVLGIFRQNAAGEELQAAERLLQRCRGYLNEVGFNQLPSLLDAWIQVYERLVSLTRQELSVSQALVQEAFAHIASGEQLERALTAKNCKGQVQKNIISTREMIDERQNDQHDCSLDRCIALRVKIETSQAALRSGLIEPMFPATFLDLSQPHDQILQRLASISPHLSDLVSVLLSCLKPIPQPTSSAVAAMTTSTAVASSSAQAPLRRPFFAENTSQQRSGAASSASVLPQRRPL